MAGSERPSAFRLARQNIYEHVRKWSIDQASDIENYVLKLPLKGEHKYFVDGNNPDGVSTNVYSAADVRAT